MFQKTWKIDTELVKVVKALLNLAKEKSQDNFYVNKKLDQTLNEGRTADWSELSIIQLKLMLVLSSILDKK